MSELVTWLWMALAGGVGAALRHLAHVGVQLAGGRSSWATLAVNAVGSFALGLLVGWAGRLVPEAVLTILGTGLLGGFTTFSTSSAESAELWRDGRRDAALVLATVMLVASVAAAGAGWALASVLP